MTSIDKFKVFVSYSRADSRQVLSLVELLERETCIQFWIDREGIESADQFEEVIIRAIDQAEVVLFMLSANSQKSQWTKDEISYAKNTGKRVVPIVLDGCELKGWFLFKFSRINYIDATKTEQLQRLVQDLRLWLHMDGKQSHTENVHEVHVKRETREKKEDTKPKPPKEPQSKQEEGNNLLNTDKPRALKEIFMIFGITILVIAFIVAVGKLMGNCSGSNEKSSSLEETEILVSVDISSPDGQIESHDYVDLGLSVKWATMNVGASSLGDYGNYYAWGETSTKIEYTEDNSKTYGKNFNDIGGVNSLDAARANWGGTWRLPTQEEFEELKDNCSWDWITYDELEGYKVTSNKNGNSIFLPATGWKEGKNMAIVFGKEEIGFYWSSSPRDESYACNLKFTSKYPIVLSSRRSLGFTIRPVSK